MSEGRFQVGDCVILNDVEQPCGRLVAVVVARSGDTYWCQYLNADPVFDSYNDPGMETSLEYATKVQDFGVSIYSDGKSYWCTVTGESFAKYPDGYPRQWQDWHPRKHNARLHLLEIIQDALDEAEAKQ